MMRRLIITRLSSAITLLPMFLLTGLLQPVGVPKLKAEAKPIAAARTPEFLPLKLDYLGEYVLPYDTALDGKPIGGLSGISYDAQRDRFYAMSDDRSEFAPARFYELKIDFDPTPRIRQIRLKRVVTIHNPQGQPYPKGRVDPEGIWVSPTGRVWISSEGVSPKEINPFVHEVDRQTGKFIQAVSFGPYFNPKLNSSGKTLVQGVRNNEGFESLTGFSDTTGKITLFAATEYSLTQDRDDGKKRSALPRILQYSVTPTQTKLTQEYAYPLDLRPIRAPFHGLVDLMAIDHSKMLSLERSFGQGGLTIKLFQLTLDGANSFTNQPVIDRTQVTPIRKRLLLNLKDLGIPLDNYEGVILGPKLSDGSQSLLIISDNNFSRNQRNSFLLFRIKGFKK